MQAYTRSVQRWLVPGILLLMLTACTTQGTRGSLTEPLTLSGPWNDTASRLIADAMIKDALEQPWARRFAQFMGRAPVVTVGTVVHRTQEPLNTQTFTQDLQRALTASGQVQVGAAAGQERAADFMLQGTIHTLVDERDSTRAASYQVDLELLDVLSNVKVWSGQKKIQKLAERSKTTL